MDRPYIHEIRIEGYLPDRWEEWFEGLALQPGPAGETILSGPLPDQAALIGVLTRLQALNLTVISVRRVQLSGME